MLFYEFLWLTFRLADDEPAVRIIGKRYQYILRDRAYSQVLSSGSGVSKGDEEGQVPAWKSAT
jgi:hypothetical protein